MRVLLFRLLRLFGLLGLIRHFRLALLAALTGSIVASIWGALLAPPSFAAPERRFMPTATATSDYRALREVVHVVLQPAQRDTLEALGQPMCAIERSGRISCAGGPYLSLRRPDAPPIPAFATPCFGAPGVFDGPDGDPLVALNLDDGLCAIGASGRVYCGSLASPPLLAWADRDAARAPDAHRPSAIALTRSAALYDDKTIRLRGVEPERFGPPRAVLGVSGRPTTMTQSHDGVLCLLTSVGHVYCTHDRRPADPYWMDPSAPLRFDRVAAPRAEHGLGPEEECTEDTLCQPLEGVVQLAPAGLLHTCALTRLGEVVCWEPTGDRPWRVPRFSDPVAFAASDSGVCAVTRVGGVECVGVDWLAEEISEPFTAVPDLTAVARVSMQGDGLCAVTHAGRVDCRMVPPPSEPATTGEPKADDEVPPAWYTTDIEPAVAIVGWTRDLDELVFAGTWSEFDEATTPLIGVTTTGRLLGTRPPPGVALDGPNGSHRPFAFVPGLPCISAGGQTFCRAIDAKGWGPWKPVQSATRPSGATPSADAAAPWWLSLPMAAVEGLDADLDGVAALLAETGLVALEIIGWDGIPCIRLDDGTVRCVRRMGTRTELVPIPAPRKDRYDVCSAFVDGRGESRLEGVIDIDGSHGVACTLLENREIVCWGNLGNLSDGAHGASRPERRWAPRVIARLHGAVELAVTSDFVCARMAPSGEVRCLGSAGQGRAPGRWGGFGHWPRLVVGLSGITRLATLPGHPVVCAWSSPPPGRTAAPQRPRAERKDPHSDPHGALADALADGQAVCWGDEDALRYLNATWLGSPVPWVRL